MTDIEQRHLKKVRRKLRGYERVMLRSGFVASRAEIEWSVKEITNSPADKYLGIEDAIVIKRGLEQFKQGKYKGNWQ
ncbi:hypothetical protein [Cloacibacillus sp. An23]|uniref:hypothetical protein n=1 Tax=Cloacibacillus sp. An23 TaxID=1965591 RepID=UPI0013024FE1|nr:hypothetical protein [Cloacibacillus sp. An23]